MVMPSSMNQFGCFVYGVSPTPHHLGGSLPRTAKRTRSPIGWARMRATIQRYPTYVQYESAFNSCNSYT